MQKLSESQRESLKQAVSLYHQALPGSPAEDFLVQRGLEHSLVSKYRFGYVQDPLPEHSKHQGKLAIPYLRWHPRYGWGCVSIRFRALDDSKPKYSSVHGDKPHIYNTPALNLPGQVVGIAEGEIDAVTASIAGLPTVGIPGATLWQSHWAEMFKGYETVIVLADGDDPGEKLGRTISKQLSNVKLIHFPDGEDVNSIWVNQGQEALRALWS